MRAIVVDDRGVEIPAATAAAVDTVKGFLIPIFTETLPNGKQRYGLGPDAFNKVVNGYACPECLADFGAIYTPVCPACGHERDINADVFREPDHWKPDPADPERAA